MQASNAFFLFDRNINSSDINYLRSTSVLYYANLGSTSEMLSYALENHPTIPDLKQIDFSHNFHKNEHKVKQKLLDFIYEYENRSIFPSNHNIKTWFSMKDFGVSAWWLSRIVEKSPLKTNLVKNLVLIYTVASILKETDSTILFIALSDRRAHHVLHPLAAALNVRILDLNVQVGSEDRKKTKLFLGRLQQTFYNSLVTIGAWIKARLLLGRIDLSWLERSDTTIVSYFPLIDKEEEKKGRFVNNYLAPLHRHFIKTRQKITTVCIPGNLEGTRFSDHIAMVKRFRKNREQNLILVHELFSINDWFRLARLFFVTVRKYLQVRDIISSTADIDIDGVSINIWPLLEDDFDDSFAGTDFINNLFALLAFQKLARFLSTDCIIFYICEMFGWERALLANTNLRGIKTIAYQHTIIPLMYLCYFYHPKQLNQGHNHLDSMPLPTVLATVGEVPRKLFIESGWDADRVVNLGACRYDHLRSILHGCTDWSNRSNMVIAATSISKDDTRRLISFLLNAFKGMDDVTVVLKPHPALPPIDELLQEMGRAKDRLPLVITHRPLRELMSKAKCMLTTVSSSGFEALAQSCPLIVLRFPDEIDCSPFSGVTQIPYFADNPQALRNTVKKLMVSKRSPIEPEACKDFIHAYFTLRNNDVDYGIAFGEIADNLRRQYEEKG